MVEKSKLDEDPQGKSVDPTRYRRMIGTFMYLIANRPDLLFAMCMCAWYQAKPTEKHLHAMLTMRVAKIPKKYVWKYAAVRLSTGRTSSTSLWHENDGNFLSKILECKVPFTERVKISSTNVRMETTVSQKEETFQVVIDLIKNSKCFKAFTISVNVPEILMQQFWYSIKKVQGTNSYKFLLANKKCVVNVDVFRTFLDIYPKVEGVNFTDVPDDDTTLAFHIKLGKRRDQDVKICHFPDSPRSSSITSSSNTTISQTSSINTIIQSKMMIPPKKSRGKGSQRKKTADESKETVDVSKESEPEPELVKRKTSSKRKVKKKVTLSANDNIIFDDLDTALELGKSISKTKAEEAVAVKESSRKGQNQIKTRQKREAGDADDEDDETEFDEDDIYKYKIHMRKDKDEEIINAEVEDSEKVDEEVTVAAKENAEKTSEVKDDVKKNEPPLTSSSLSVSLGFGDQFLKLSSDSSLVSTVKDTTDAEINSLLEVKIKFEVPHTQSPFMLSVPVFMISKPIVLTPVHESPLIATITTLPPPSVYTTPSLRVAKLEKDVSELKKIDLSAEALAALKTQVPSVVDNYLGFKVRDVFQKELKKHITDLIQKYSLQQIPELPKKQIPTADLE
uniref:RVT_2 domain-containing protein n=1 Tax=Tanacetum cinerariifolium TaxID=118510 RepID=A0A6L2K3I5_TANCI|nr:RVT_2 domain-containing protein [Tanacetum cinerariifolium]